MTRLEKEIVAKVRAGVLKLGFGYARDNFPTPHTQVWVNTKLYSNDLSEVTDEEIIRTFIHTKNRHGIKGQATRQRMTKRARKFCY